MATDALIQKIREGDREAFRTLFAQYGGAVYQKALLETHDRDLARIVTRDTFREIGEALRGQTPVNGWDLWIQSLAKKNAELAELVKNDVAALEPEALLEKPARKPEAEKPRIVPPVPVQKTRVAPNPVAAEPPEQSIAAKPTESPAAPARRFAADTRELPRVDDDWRRFRDEADEPDDEPDDDMDDDEDERDETPALALPETPLDWAVSGLLAVAILLMLWMCLGFLMGIGILPKTDLGYAWFDRALFRLFSF